MQIEHLLRINDWEIGKFLRLVLFVQAAFLAVACLNSLGFETPIFTQMIAFVYLTFIPGIVILRALRLHDLSAIETLLYSVGLSIAFLMFLGAIMNSFYSSVIPEPISFTPLAITVSIAVLTLSFVSYKRDRDYSKPPYVDVKREFSFTALALCLLPLLTIFGTYLMNSYDNNIILLTIFFILSLMPIAVVFNRIPPKLYPLAVFATSISLLYSTSLISANLSGWDIQGEYYFANLVRSSSHWNPTLPHDYNAVLSVVMLSPILSYLSRIGLVAVLKTIYPLLFSLVPLGLYRIFQKGTNDKIAFLSSFFFMETFVFFGEMVQLARQEIASLFLVLLMFLMIEWRPLTSSKGILFIVFSLSLIVSHYALSYVFLFAFILTWVALIITRTTTMQTLSAGLHRRIGKSETERNSAYKKTLNTSKSTFVAMGSILTFAVFAFAWYTYVSGSSALTAITTMITHIGDTIFTEFLNPKAVQGLQILATETVSPLHEVTKILYILFSVFIVIGFFVSILGNRISRFTKEYFGFSFANLILALACVSVPYFASALNTTRLYLITLFFLAPFCVIGGVALFGALGKKLRTPLTSHLAEGSLKIVSVLLAIFLLFNCGFVYQVAKDNPTSTSLNSTVDYPRFNDQEVYAAKWITDLSENSFIYGDAYGRQLLYEFVADSKVRTFWGTTKEIPSDAYVYLRSLNIRGKVMLSEETYPENYTCIQDSTFYKVLKEKNRIYDNGGAAIYH
jgi:uncharacterized membrane protein